MKPKLTHREKRLIKEHNAKAKIVFDTAKANGFSEAVLFYAAHLGIMGIPWIVKGKKQKAKKR